MSRTQGLTALKGKCMVHHHGLNSAERMRLKRSSPLRKTGVWTDPGRLT